MSKQSINWGRLVSQGRAKAVGVSWSEEELDAIHKLKIPFEFVRQGILTSEDYEKAIEKGAPEDKRTKEQLLKEARDEGINASPEATPEVLKEEIAKKKEVKKPAKVESKPKVKAKPKKK